ncbi:MAG: hypothetical protein ABSB82_00420 [Terriglobia bacterium]
MMKYGAKRFALLIFLVAFVFRLAVVWETGLFRGLPGRTEVERIAHSVVAYGEYGNPYTLHTGATAHSTPVYPLFLAGLFALFGTGVLTEIVRTTITCAISALRCALVPLFALDAGLDPRTAALAAGLSVFYIPALETEVRGTTDGAWLALVLIAVIWASLRIWRSRSWQSRTSWWFFALCGFAALLDSSILPLIGGLLMAGAIACPVGFRKRYLRQVLFLSLSIFLFLLPWAVRNHFTLNKLIWTKSNFGLEFWMSNGPERAFDLATNMGDPYLHPSHSVQEARLVQDLGEVRYNQQKMEEAMAWVRANPGEFLHLTFERIVAWWFPPGPNFAVQAAKICLSLLAFAGLAFLFRTQPLAAWLFLLTWITYPDVYYVLQWSSRYRFPMEWQLLMCGSVPLAIAYGTLTGHFKKTA